MEPWKLIGMQYRLGADPVRHGKADCLSLARAVLDSFGIESPEPKRDWYRRLRRGDHSVFEEELEAWGEKIGSPRLGAVALCLSPNGAKGLATYWEDGWIAFASQAAKWFPIGAIHISAIYFPRSES